MAFADFYDTGTVTVTGASATVTGSGTLWSGLVLPGDTLECAGLMVRVLDVVDDDTITLVKPWPGSTASGAAYSITYNSPTRFELAYVAERARELIARQAILARGSAIFACLDVGLNTPPGSPAADDLYVVGTSPTGAWVGYAGYLAQWSGTAWIFTAPETGMQAQDMGSDPPAAYVRGTSAWVLKSEASDLADLQDVDFGTPSTGDVLTFNGTDWVDAPPAVPDFADIGDVDLTGAAAGYVLTFDGTDWVPEAPEPHRGRNLLFNPGGAINQRGATSIADDVYGVDRWYALTQSGAVAISTLADVADGVPHMMRLTQSQASAQRMGQAQILEAADSKWMRGRSVALSGKARCSANATLRYAILAWTGTADSPTSDVVADWTSGSYTAGGFFLGSNLAVVGVGSLALTANTLTDLTALTAAMPSGLNNAIVMYWSEGTLAQTVTLDAALQLEEGAVAHPLAFRPLGSERLLCRRYFQADGGDDAFERFGQGSAASTTVVRFIASFEEMRVKPSLFSVSAAAHFAADDLVGFIGGSAISFAEPSRRSVVVALTVSGATQYRPYLLMANNTLLARFYRSAEL